MATNNTLTEIRWHGRGGQGGVTSAEVIAQGAISEGKYGQAFPSFGPERRGAPVQAFNRVDSARPIRVRAEITEPDVVAVLDPGLMAFINVAAGLKEGGVAIINTRKTVAEIAKEFNIKGRVATVNATKISVDYLGSPFLVNVAMIGAYLSVRKGFRIEEVEEAIKNFINPRGHRIFDGKRGEMNFKALREGHKTAKF